jgi:hypothetical protein
MNAIMRVHGLADGSVFRRELWVERYDVDAFPDEASSYFNADGSVVINGAFGGTITLTYDREHALRFNGVSDAMTAWNRISVTRPRRPDGRPNKPLTALTIEVEPA